jgi:hypothetical protein
MPVLDISVPNHLLWPEDASWPRRRIAKLIRRFGTCFPNIAYEIKAGLAVANAQALRSEGKNLVLVYGGLLRHRLVGSAGLSVALAHETGHHLGGEPRMKFLRWLSSEERADEWARDVGLPALYAARAPAVWRRGRRELDDVARSVGLRL